MRLAILLFISLLFLGCVSPPPEATPTPTATPEITPTLVPTATPEATPTPTPTLPAPANFTNYANRYAVVASGYSGTPTHAGWYRTSTLMMHDLLTDEYGFAPDDVYYLHEFTNYPEVDYEANLGNFYGVLAEIKEKSTEDDLVLLYLVGHGNMGNGDGAYSLVDEDVTGPQIANMLSGIKAKRVVIILTPCNSGALIPSLSKEGRVVITSTEAPEANSAGFAEYMIDGLKGNATLAQAFQHANEGVFTWYRNRGISDIREHPLLDDNGDGVGHRSPIPNNGDGYIAANTTLRWA